MAGSGMILGGLLGGLGKGMEMDFMAKREEALENLRNQRQIEREGRIEEAGIRQEGREETRLIAKEDRADKRAIAEDERTYIQKTGLLGLTHKYKMAEGETEQAYKERLEGIKAANDRKLATLKSGLDRSNDAASQKLAAQIDAGQIDSTEVDENGYIVKVFKDGSTEKTNIIARKTATEIEAEGEEADRKARKERREARTGGAESKPKKLEKAMPRVTEFDYNSKFWQPALDRVQRGEPGWKGLNEAQIKAKIRQAIRSQGYDVPEGY